LTARLSAARTALRFEPGAVPAREDERVRVEEFAACSDEVEQAAH